MPEINVEVCSNCHPFYTGQLKFVDAAGRVDSFRARQKAAKSKVMSKSDRRKLKKVKRIREQMDRPDSLSELRKTFKTAKAKKK